MEYTIINRTTTVNTVVEYDFNGIKVTAVVSHFEPQSEDDIVLGITNRAITIERELQEGLQ